MPRVKRGTIAHKRRKHLLEYAKGYRWGRKSKFKAAKQAVYKAFSYAYRDRKVKKRNFRQLWNIHINYAVREKGLSYSHFIHLLKQKNIEINRKILSELSAKKPSILDAIVKKANQ